MLWKLWFHCTYQQALESSLDQLPNSVKASFDQNFAALKSGKLPLCHSWRESFVAFSLCMDCVKNKTLWVDHIMEIVDRIILFTARRRCNFAIQCLGSWIGMTLIEK